MRTVVKFSKEEAKKILEEKAREYLQNFPTEIKSISIDAYSFPHDVEFEVTFLPLEQKIDEDTNEVEG